MMWCMVCVVVVFLFVVGFFFVVIVGEVEDWIKVVVMVNMCGKVMVDQVMVLLVVGVYEVLFGLDIFYVDLIGCYGFVDGCLVDLQQFCDFMVVWLDQLICVDFQKLLLDLVIKEVCGNGCCVLVVFEDLGCLVCRLLYKFMFQLLDVMIYYFVYFVIDLCLVLKLCVVWCFGNWVVVWQVVMCGGEVQGSGNCDVSGIQCIVNLGEELKLQGIFVVVLVNGKWLVGVMLFDQFFVDFDELIFQVVMCC